MPQPQPSDHTESILGAVSHAAESFASARSWRDAADGVLAELGEAVEASRVYIFRNLTDDQGRLCMDGIVEWVAPDIAPTIAMPDNDARPYGEELDRWVEILGAGGTIQSTADDLPASERAQIDHDIVSLCIVPISAGGEWWGYLGFDDCSTERLWSMVEIAALRAGAAAIGAAIDRERLDEERRKAELYLQSHLEHLPAVTYIEVTDPTHVLGFNDAYVSPQIEELTGYTPEEWIGDKNYSTWNEVLHPEDRERSAELASRTSESGEPYLDEYRIKHRVTGEWVWVRDQSHLVTIEGMRPYWHGVMVDITAQKEAEHQLARAQEQYQSLVEGIPAMVYLDSPGQLEGSLYVSPRCEEILGITAEAYQADPQLWLAIVHPDDRDRVRETNDTHLEKGTRLEDEYRVVRPDGRVTWVNEQAEVLLDEDGKPFLIQGVIFDITERKQAEEQIAFLAYHDALTGLANRALFEEMLDPAVARARRNDLAVAVMFLDLDRFKEVNDTHGHAVGDELLRGVAHRLVECVRDTDLVARQGGDEFLVLLPDMEPGTEEAIAGGRSNAIQVAENLAQRVRKTMRVPFSLPDGERQVEINTSASIGVSVFPFDSSDARSLLKNADSAMYEGKKTKPGSFAMHAQAEDNPLVTQSLSWRLRRAVKDQAWDLHYQPVVELATGRITDAEALLRWHRPDGGFVPPSDFIPLAEQMGLLEIIGEWVFDQICRQRTAWLRQDIDLHIGFNLSPRQLWQRDIVERLAMGLRSEGMLPTDILIEVSEVTAMTDPSRTQRVLWALHEAGFRIAIDDFGTGYSPVARIWHLPVDVVKIDQPLIRDLPADSEVASFVGAVIEFAKARGTVTHAEGVETPEQHRFLVEQGCEMGQGYLFSRPLPPAELTALYLAGDGIITPRESR